MRKHRGSLVGAIVLALAVLTAACGDSGGGDSSSDTTATKPKGSIVDGSTNFSEQLIVAQLYG